MIFVATLIALIGIYLMQDDGVLTQSLLKKISSGLLLLLSGILLSMEYGTLRAVFILIALVSLLGTLMTLFLYKFQGDK